jgi:ribose/xylose/arabinose/galactoside ABC-type transport system permease subunit
LPFALACGLALFGAATITGFASVNNGRNLLDVYSPLLIVCLGQMLVMLTGGIDLSVTATMALCSVVGAKLMSEDTGWIAPSAASVPVAIVAMLGVSVCIGLLNGFAVAYLRMPPFMVTLTTMIFVAGLATYVTQSEQVGGLPSSFVDAATNTTFTILLAVLLAIACFFLLRNHVFGKWLFAVGQNIRTARVSGVPTEAVIVASYVLSGLAAALASMIYTGQLATGSPSLGENLLLDIIGAVVIGGTSLFGGRGDVRLLCGGVLFFVLLDSILNLMGWSHFGVMIAKGVMILSAATIDSVRARWSQA